MELSPSPCFWEVDRSPFAGHGPGASSKPLALGDSCSWIFSPAALSLGASSRSAHGHTSDPFQGITSPPLLGSPASS
eukprot:4049562-Heterocapsa_arctica.AAC.1